LLLAAAILGQLFRLQVLQHQTFIAQASKQYNIYRSIPAKRGEFFWQDLSTNEILPLVINRPFYNFYVVPQNIASPDSAVDILTKVLTQDLGYQIDKNQLLPKLSQRQVPYERIVSNLTEQKKDFITDALSKQGFAQSAYGFEENFERYYVAEKLTSHLTGFLGFAQDGNSRLGQYGLEEYFNTLLQGKEGLIFTDKDVQGRPIAVGKRVLKPAYDGDDIILTIDKNIQYKACILLQKYIKQYGAAAGAVVIMDPQTGKIYALCGKPDFDPNQYGKETAAHFVNPVASVAYEPGSTFKPITMAAALDLGAITPWTTYLDTGSIIINKYTIKNSDSKAHGINTMIDVLDKSLNTGAIFAMRSIGFELFEKYVNKFGFGKLTGIELAAEVDGDISPLSKGREIYAATASFGQGITVTPLQLITAYATIARGGVLIKPTLVQEIGKAQEKEVFKPRQAARVISKKTADTLSLMLVSSVKKGYAKKAGVPGYKIAGKTGTAQIPKTEAAGYGDESIHSFVGFGPVGEQDPIFVMLVKLDKPTAVRFSADSAAPLFGEIAKFLLDYFEVPPDD